MVFIYYHAFSCGMDGRLVPDLELVWILRSVIARSFRKCVLSFMKNKQLKFPKLIALLFILTECFTLCSYKHLYIQKF